MTDSYVQVQPDSSGKKLQTYNNTVGGQSVHSEAMTLTSNAGVPAAFIGDAVRVVSQDYQQAIVDAGITGHTPFVKLGNVTTVNNTEQDMWTTGGKYVFPTAKMQMEIVSTSTLDDVGSTGITSVKIYYLDDTYTEKTETIELDGQTPVATAATDIFRVNAIRAASVGSGGKAAGTITLRHLNDTPIYRSIAPGYTRGRSLIYTVPAGKSLYITESNISSSATAAGHYTIFTLRANYDDRLLTKVSWMQPLAELALQDAAFRLEFKAPLKIPATCDILMSVIADASNANTVCYGSIRGWTE